MTQRLVQPLHKITHTLLCLALGYLLEIGVYLGVTLILKALSCRLKLLYRVLTRLGKEQEKAQVTAAGNIVVCLLLALGVKGGVKILAQHRLYLNPVVRLKIVAYVAYKALQQKALFLKLHY